MDTWGLAVLLYEVLAGSSPVKGRKPKFPLSFPPLARDLIEKMLQKGLSVPGIKSHS